MPIVYTGRVLSVEVGRRRFPNGREHDVVVVRHPPSVVILPVAEDGRLVLVKQYRAPLDRDTWEFPAGSVNPGESPEAAARRECEEEIGRVPHALRRVGAWYPVPGYGDELMIFFKASDLRPSAPGSAHTPDEDEDIETALFTVDEVRTMAAAGEIVDLKTAYGVTLIEPTPGGSSSAAT